MRIMKLFCDSFPPSLDFNVGIADEKFFPQFMLLLFLFIIIIIQILGTEKGEENYTL